MKGPIATKRVCILIALAIGLLLLFSIIRTCMIYRLEFTGFDSGNLLTYGVEPRIRLVRRPSIIPKDYFMFTSDTRYTILSPDDIDPRVQKILRGTGAECEQIVSEILSWRCLVQIDGQCVRREIRSVRDREYPNRSRTLPHDLVSSGEQVSVETPDRSIGSTRYC